MPENNFLLSVGAVSYCSFTDHNLNLIPRTRRSARCPNRQLPGVTRESYWGQVVDSITKLLLETVSPRSSKRERCSREWRRRANNLLIKFSTIATRLLELLPMYKRYVVLAQYGVVCRSEHTLWPITSEMINNSMKFNSLEHLSILS